MTAAAFSAFQARAGAAIVHRMANAAADFGGGFVVEKAMLRRDSSAVLGASTAGMFAREIVLTVVVADLGPIDPKRGTPLMIDGVDYRVIVAEKDLEHGVVELVLEKVTP